IREISIMRGHDPRNFSLFAYGGAGPLHGALVADQLEMLRVVVPPHAGTFSAFGLLAADGRAEATIPINRPLAECTESHLEALKASLAVECRERLEADRAEGDEVVCSASIDLRYARQAVHLNLPITENLSPKGLADRFNLEYQRQFSHVHDDPVEACNLRVAAVRKRQRPRTARLSAVSPHSVAGVCNVIFDSKSWAATRYSRKSFSPPEPINGPCIIEEYGATTFVPPHYTARVDVFHNLVLERRR